MVDIMAFKGIVYNKEKIKDIYSVLAPPYDVIDKDKQEILYNRSPYNIIRLILGKIMPDDNEENNRYKRAASYFNEFLKAQILIEYNKPAIFVYKQHYNYKSVSKTRIGFICLLRLEDFSKGIIFPHENTLSKPKQDRYLLLKECKANLSPIFGMFSESEGYMDNILAKCISNINPYIDISDDEGVEHKLWIVSDNDVIDRLTQLIKPHNIFIADGHHRYETALAYRDEFLKKDKDITGKEFFNYVLTYLTNMDNDGLSILPIHRLIKHISGFKMDNFLKEVAQYFNINKLGFIKGDEAGKDKMKKTMFEYLWTNPNNNYSFRFGLYVRDGNFYVITLRNDVDIQGFFDKTKPKEWQQLDIVVLHNILIDHILKINENTFEEKGQINYTEDDNKAINEVDKQHYQMAIFLNPTPINMIKTICQYNHKMPQKSTFFYPKLLSGLVINKF